MEWCLPTSLRDRCLLLLLLSRLLFLAFFFFFTLGASFSDKSSSRSSSVDQMYAKSLDFVHSTQTIIHSNTPNGLWDKIQQLNSEALNSVKNKITETYFEHKSPIILLISQHAVFRSFDNESSMYGSKHGSYRTGSTSGSKLNDLHILGCRQYLPVQMLIAKLKLGTIQLDLN